MGKIRWTEKSISHLEAIHKYIAADSVTYANRFVKALIQATTKLESLPFCGRIVPELEDDGFREVIFQNYRIVYRVLANGVTVEILAVIHGARELESAIKGSWEL